MSLGESKSIVQSVMKFAVMSSEMSARKLALSSTPLKEGQLAKVKADFIRVYQSTLTNDENSLQSDKMLSSMNNLATRKEYAPQSMLADGMGMVTYLEVDTAREMIDMNRSKRIFEAGVKYYNALSKMSSAALKIGSF